MSAERPNIGVGPVRDRDQGGNGGISGDGRLLSGITAEGGNGAKSQTNGHAKRDRYIGGSLFRPTKIGLVQVSLAEQPHGQGKPRKIPLSEQDGLGQSTVKAEIADGRAYNLWVSHKPIHGQDGDSKRVVKFKSTIDGGVQNIPGITDGKEHLSEVVEAQRELARNGHNGTQVSELPIGVFPATKEVVLGIDANGTASEQVIINFNKIPGKSDGHDKRPTVKHRPPQISDEAFEVYRRHLEKLGKPKRETSGVRYSFWTGAQPRIG